MTRQTADNPYHGGYTIELDEAALGAIIERHIGALMREREFVTDVPLVSPIAHLLDRIATLEARLAQIEGDGK